MTDAQQEPSMEDILASIRHILSEDEEEPPSASGKNAIEPAFEPEPDFEPEMEFEPEPKRVSGPRFAPQSEEEEDVLELTDDMLVEEAEMPFIPPRPLSPQVHPRMEPEEEDEGLMSPPAAAVSAAALSGLARMARERTVLLGHGEITLEAIVRETLRPLLKAWLDEYLPPMVERIVAREIERLVHQVSDESKW